MHMQGVFCEERRRLETLIRACLRSASYIARTSARIAGNAHREGTISQSLKNEYIAMTARLDTLRECLALHQQLHQCDQVFTPLRPTPKSPRTGPGPSSVTLTDN